MADQTLELKVKLQLEDLKRAVAEGSRVIKSLETTKATVQVDTSQIAKARTLLDDLVTGLAQGVGQQLSFQLAQIPGRLVAGIQGAVQSVLSVGSEFEKTEVAFKTFLGSAEKAKALLKEITDFAANTPFELPEVIAASRSLVAFGIEAENIQPTLKALGDIASGVSAPIGEIAELYGKARVQGRLFQEDINQLTGRGIPIIGQLAKQFNVTEAEIRTLTEKGKIGFADIEKAFIAMSSEGGKFFDLMKSQSSTVGGKISNLADQFTKLQLTIFESTKPAFGAVVDLVGNIGTELNKAAKESAPALRAEADALKASLEANPEVAKKIGEALNEASNVLAGELLSGAKELATFLSENPETISETVKGVAELTKGIGFAVTEALKLVNELSKAKNIFAEGSPEFIDGVGVLSVEEKAARNTLDPKGKQKFDQEFGKIKPLFDDGGKAAIDLAVKIQAASTKITAASKETADSIGKDVKRTITASPAIVQGLADLTSGIEELEKNKLKSTVAIRKKQSESELSLVESAKVANDALLALEEDFLTKKIALAQKSLKGANASDTLKIEQELQKSLLALFVLTNQKKISEEQKGIKAIQERAAAEKVANESKIAGLELEISKQGQLNALADAQRAVTAQQQELSKANTDGILQGYDQQLQSLERAKTLAAELASDQTTDAQLRLALQNELARLGFNANTSEKDFLLTKQRIEDQLASAKKNALLTEQQIQRENLKLDLARNAAARTAADLQANITLLKAKSETLSAQAAVNIEKNPEQKKNLESVVNIRKQQEKLAEDAIANQKEINKLGEQSDKISEQVLETTQANARSQFEYTEKIRESNKEIDRGRQAQELKNKSIKDATSAQKELTAETARTYNEIQEGIRKASLAEFNARDALNKQRSARFEVEKGSEQAVQAVNEILADRTAQFKKTTGFNQRKEVIAEQRKQLEQILGLRAFNENAVSNAPRSFTDGRSTTSTSSVNNQNTINIIDSSDPFGDATRALIAVGRA